MTDDRREKLGENENRKFLQSIPDDVLEIARILREHNHKSFIVGGAIRDIILGREVSDWDVATSATPDDVSVLFSRIVKIGIPHGCVMVSVKEGSYHAVTTFRRDWNYSDARRPDGVSFTRNIDDDLERRDFTMNAVAYDPFEGVLIDPCFGREDIEDRILATVGDPKERFHEDALRLVRAARFAAVLEFDIEDETLAAMSSGRERLKLISRERIREEIMKMLAAVKPSAGFEIMDETSLLELVIEPLHNCRGITQNEFHAYDVFYHSIYAADFAPVEKLLVRLAALLHDVGKPLTRDGREGQATFYNHEAASARIADEWMRTMKFSNEDRETVVHLIRYHMFDYKSEWTDGAVRRFIRNVGADNIADMFDLRIADFLGNGLRQGFPGYLEEFRQRIDGIIEADSAFSLSHLAVNGDDIVRELGITPGPAVGRILEQLLEIVTDSPEKNSREELLRLARQEVRREEP